LALNVFSNKPIFSQLSNTEDYINRFLAYLPLKGKDGDHYGSAGANYK
jgi:hypothetical protein